MTSGSPHADRPRQLIPVACTLDRGDAEERIDAWRRAFSRMAFGVERPRPGQLRVSLRDDRGGVAKLIDLAQAEKRCCAFFDFALLIDAGGFVLSVEVPDESAAVLDDFARLVPAL